MTEESYEGLTSSDSEPSVFDAKIAVLLGPFEQKTVLSEATVTGELVSGVLGNGLAQVSINDTVNLLLEAVVGLGETVSDQIGAPYSSAMPNFLAEFAAALLQAEYTEEDDARQAVNRKALGLPPLQH